MFVSGPGSLPWARGAAALLAGVLMPYAFSPYDHVWLAWLAMACWVGLFRHGHAFFIGFTFGFGWFGFGAWWLADTLHLYGHLHYLLAVFCVGLVGAVLALFPALWAWLSMRLAGDSGWLMLVFPAVGVGIEWLRGHIFTGLPWTALGNLLLETPAVGWGSRVGVYGLTLLPALAAVSLLLLFTPAWRRWGAGGLIAACLLLFTAPAPFTAAGVERHAVLVQANIPQDVKWDAGFVAETMRRYVSLSEGAAADVIVWPEAAVPFFLSQAPGWDDWLTEHIRHWQVPLLFGGLKLLEDGRTGQNGLFLADPQTGQRQFAGKHHLVPFGEYVPGWLPFLHTLVPEIADFRPAKDSGVLTWKGQKFGALICYESIFPEQTRQRIGQGAEVLVNVTNDAWYGTSPAAWQHLQAMRMRAVEAGRYVLRAANTGISAIIAPDGSLTATAPWWTQAVISGTYRTSTQITPYQQWGDMPLLACLLPALLPAWIRRRRYL